MNTSYTATLNSSAVRKLTYHPLSQKLQLWFSSGGPYDFFRVPEDLVQRLLRSSSPGSFYNTHLRGRYQR